LLLLNLRRRWRRFWRRVSPSRDFRSELAALDRRYREPHRFYHGWGHIRRCLAELDRCRRLASEPEAVELALWYHDAVYDPKAADNELRSALLAVQAARAAGLGEGFARAVSALILSTRVSVPAAGAAAGGQPELDGAAAGITPAGTFADGSETPGGPAATTDRGPAAPADVALVRDIDLSVLGSPRRRYRRYERNIRREYAWVPWDEYRARRGALLRGFLDRQAIYATEPFRARYDGRARRNLRWALRRLEGKGHATAPGAVRGGRTPPPGRKGSGSR
jgi:predicted metal-dependent HD superfamily phosphohydrolase